MEKMILIRQDGTFEAIEVKQPIPLLVCSTIGSPVGVQKILVAGNLYIDLCRCKAVEPSPQTLNSLSIAAAKILFDRDIVLFGDCAIVIEFNGRPIGFGDSLTDFILAEIGKIVVTTVTCDISALRDILGQATEEEYKQS